MRGGLFHGWLPALVTEPSYWTPVLRRVEGFRGKFSAVTVRQPGRCTLFGLAV